MRKKNWIILITLSTVFLGGLIYLLWYPDNVRVFHWLELIHLSAPVEFIRNYSMSVYQHIPEWVIFSLPNGLWAFAYALIITYFWWGSSSSAKYFWLGTIPALGIGYEILQLGEVIPGVFCYQDLFLGAGGVVGGIFLGAKIKRRELYND